MRQCVYVVLAGLVGGLSIPAPSLPQLTALAHTFTVFHHYSLCTYLGCQWDLQTAPAANFAPPDAGPDMDQWMAVSQSIGATQACLTVRHVDGFALWPTATTNYSVAASAWRGGKGDVVADFVAAARRAGISPCFYIILGFDVSANHSGVAPAAYLDAQVTALTELLTSYGQIDRLWLDNYAIGCCQPVTTPLLYCPGGGTTSEPSAACPGWQVLIDTVRALSPGTAMIPGPDGCLVNGESFGGTYPLYHASRHAQASYSCTDASAPSGGQAFSLTESDFTVLQNDAFFWSASDTWYNGSTLYAQFQAKLEQGASIILNIPPNTSGVIPQPIVDELAEFARLRAAAWAAPAGVLPAPASAPCAALSVVLPVAGDFDTVLLSEDLSAGQVIASYSLEARDAASGAWRPLGGAGVHGRTVGSRLVDGVGLQAGVDAVRLNCTGDLTPVPPPPPATFVNAGGACMGLPDGQAWPCYVGPAQPGGEVFHLCPLVAASCGPAAVWTPGDAAGTLFALSLSPSATINIDCDACTPGTHAKIIADGDCNCASALVYDAAATQLAVAACSGMCLTNGTAPGAHASCAGDEPWTAEQLHLAPCSDESTRGWTRVPVPAAAAAPVRAPAANATVAVFGAYLSPAGAAKAAALRGRAAAAAAP